MSVQAWLPAGGQDGLVRLAEVAAPDPGPDQALVAVEAFSVNRGETLLLERPRPGHRPGKDVAGTVVRAAADGSGPAPGTRVVGHPPYGGWSTLVPVATGDLAVLPPSLPATVAAALPLAGLTALRLVRRAGSLAGRRLLVTGASGGVGHYVVELAAAAGAEVTAISASAERGERLLVLGAAEVRADLPAQGRPFDVVMESVGGEHLRAALALLREEGLLLWFGQAGRRPATLDFFEFWNGPVQATITHFDYTRGDRSYGEDLATLVHLVATGRLHPELGVVRPWTETPEVIAMLRGRQIRGNAVLTLPPARLDHERTTDHVA
ncbi:MAG TPA: zinc-binding dehydrogenase [Nocardioides sp.]|uniref:zinc-binding dehydrogenase n=1 Tax=Nocardioides sp. TaxID=35761 RepID=UPI002E32C79E|nr:zinc-binding dehydrogenase [Nocardioides sp.]HEX5087146.1 zinc-binding dehydrogenase [Nocardioides sp.]